MTKFPTLKEMASGIKRLQRIADMGKDIVIKRDAQNKIKLSVYSKDRLYHQLYTYNYLEDLLYDWGT